MRRSTASNGPTASAAAISAGRRWRGKRRAGRVTPGRRFALSCKEMPKELPMSDLADLFPGYASEWINTTSGRIFARVGGKGPPLLLLHGFSQTHVQWHRVAPHLADKFTLIIADLPGYGWSDMPAR